MLQLLDYSKLVAHVVLLQLYIVSRDSSDFACSRQCVRPLQTYSSIIIYYFNIFDIDCKAFHMDSRRVLLSYNRGWGANKVRDIS